MRSQRRRHKRQVQSTSLSTSRCPLLSLSGLPSRESTCRDLPPNVLQTLGRKSRRALRWSSANQLPAWFGLAHTGLVSPRGANDLPDISTAPRCVSLQRCSFRKRRPQPVHA